MQVLFLHLSDIHLQVNHDYSSDKIRRIVDAVPCELPFDCAFLIISGDLAKSGSAAEYHVAKRLIDDLICGFRSKGITPGILFVPGNHDISIPQGSPTAEMLIERKRNSLDDAYAHELEKMDPFFEFANEHRLFRSEYSDSTEQFDIGDQAYCIKATMLNSAPFSTRERTDKEIHYLPERAICSIEKSSNTNLNIVIMHHGCEWFDDESKRRLEQRLYEHCDILFIGHEHDGFAESYTNSNRQHLTVSRGGVISTSSYDESSFSLLHYDSETMLLTSIYFIWDRQCSIYTEHNRENMTLRPKTPGQATPNTEFIEALKPNFNLINAPLESYFVFPVLETSIHVDDDPFPVIASDSEFFDFISTNPCLNIVGSKSSGKTALLMHLYNSSIAQGYSPLFLGESNSRPSIKYLFDDLIGEQYGRNESASARFKQSSIQKKVLFIDDFDRLKRNGSDAAFIREALNNVGCVVLTSSQKIDTGIIEDVRRELGDDDAIVTYSIKNFFNGKRDELVYNTCRELHVAPNNIQGVIGAIDRAVHSHSDIFSLSPEFILQSVIYYADKNPTGREKTIPFNEIFEANIVNRLRQAWSKSKYGATKEGGVREALALLGEIAYRMHKAKNATIEASTLFDKIQQYADEYALESCPRDFVELACEADIIRMGETAPCYYFISNTVFAYFVARRINLMKDKGDDIHGDVDYLVENICFNINENILLFLSYLRNNSSFAGKLLSCAEEALSPFEEFSVEAKNIRFLTTGQYAKINMANEDDRHAADNMVSQCEEEISNKRQEEGLLEYAGLYDYDEKDRLTNSNRILRALKYLEIAGKSFVMHFATTPKIEKYQTIKALYELPNRIIFGMLHKTDENYDEIIDQLLEIISEDGSLSNITKDELKDILYKVGIATCLSVYDQASYYCSTGDTVKLLSTREQESSTYRIQRLMMMENSTFSSEDYIDQAVTLMEKAQKENRRFEILCIQVITNKHIINTPNIKPSTLQKASKKIFFCDSPKSLIARNRQSTAENRNGDYGAL